MTHGPLFSVLSATTALTLPPQISTCVNRWHSQTCMQIYCLMRNIFNCKFRNDLPEEQPMRYLKVFLVVLSVVLCYGGLGMLALWALQQVQP